MDEDEAALLAELRAISQKSAASRRFAADDDDADSDGITLLKAEPAAAAAATSKKGSPQKMTEIQSNLVNRHAGGSRNSSSSSAAAAAAAVPPWKRKSNVSANNFGGRSCGTTAGGEDAMVTAVAAAEPPVVNAATTTAAAAADLEEKKAEDESEAATVAVAVTMPPPPVRKPQTPDTSGRAAAAAAANDRASPPWKRKQAHTAPSNDVLVYSNNDNIINDDNNNNAFTGERGGAAEDAELLALLRGVSNKSSSASRFDDDNINNNNHDDKDDREGTTTTTAFADTDAIQYSNNNTQQRPLEEDEPVVPGVVVGTPPLAVAEKANKKRLTPPWKRKLVSKQEQQPDVGTMPRGVDDAVVVVAAATPSNNSMLSSAFGNGTNIHSEQPSTFTGERGGAAEDAELLALLRGVSNKSASSRYDDDDNGTADASESAKSKEEMAAVVEPITAVVAEKSKNHGFTPPWKRKTAVAKPPNVEVVVVAAAPLPPPPLLETSALGGGGIKSDLPKSTFQGERGGAAEDAELLALLRGVSNKSAASRFDDDDDARGNNSQAAAAAEHEGYHEQPELQNVPPPPSEQVVVAKTKAKGASILTPPWKRKAKATAATKNDVDVVVAVAAAPPPAALEATESHQGPTTTTATTCGFKSDFPKSTFKGDRGGAAEDAELLALLRGVSNKSANSRFSDTDEPEDTTSTLLQPTTTTTKDEPVALEVKSKVNTLPPWKRGAKRAPTGKQPVHVEVVVASPPMEHGVDSSLQEATRSYRIKSELTSTFKGDRGGAAEDAELLALLRGVSNKSANSRFGETDESAVGDTKREHLLPTTKKEPFAPKAPTGKQSVHDEVGVVAPPMEQGDDSSVQEATPSYGIKSELTSTFKGDRGGAAEDAELLALLRGVSSESSANRFSDSAALDRTAPKSAIVAATRPTAKPAASPTIQSPTDPTAPACDGETIPRENVPKSLTDKNWKVRCQAYDVLASILQELADTADDLIDSNRVLEGLDDRIPIFVEDGNAGALDKALEFANLYAEYCRGAGDSEQARRIVSSLVKKNALSSRPTTLKLASELTLKLMEVGLDGASSVHSVVDVLLNEGLASKKPKVIQASASLILEAAYQFGATSLPLALITSAAQKLLLHSNSTVRDCCIKILAEICRALGSKAPIQGVIDGMKKTQLSELDSQLSEQPEPTAVRTGLRSSAQGSCSSSPDDALAALQAGSKELDAQRFEARSAVNLVAAVAKTEYASQITLAKWSEKVAALDKVLDCGGEKPYKLAQPSSSVNYGPLIVDMRKLLSHTHFAVCSKAIQVLSMLAEGVGEKLYPHLRPALSPLIQLSKDKKLTNAVSSGLDSLFGNVLGFESLLDSDDAISSAVDEKNQKNALARATALGYLRRCVERIEAAGPKGTLSSQSAAAVAILCANKLDDSDASVRKASMDVLESLQQLANEDILEKVRKVIETLQTSNPRAYKALSKGATENAAVPKPSAVSSRRPHASAPAKSSSIDPASLAALKKASAVPATSTVALTGPVASLRNESASPNDRPAPRFEEALVHVTSLNIPQWDAAEEEGGIFLGLKAAKWQLRHDAIESLRSYVESGHLDEASLDVEVSSSSILLVVREQTRGFKETNVNIMKAILQLFIAICEYRESKELPLGSWAVRDVASVCVQKISDRKLTGSCNSLLTAACVISLPSSVLLFSVEELKSVKSPVAHEEFLKWFQTFCADFGAAAIGSGISDIIPHLLEELGSVNTKVKREATSCFGLLYQQVGPGLKALAISLAKPASIKDLLQKSFDENQFDPSFQSASWSRMSIVGRDSTSHGRGQLSSSAFALDVPKTNLFAALPFDILAKLGSKDGKTAWKMRKEAMDEIEVALNSCSGLLETTPPQMKQLADLTRCLRDRLTDTQINLRPTAARIVGSLLAAVDKSSQAKLGRIVLAPLINSAMNDIKKPMRDSSLTAIRTSITASSLDGGGFNELALEAFVCALVAEVNEAAIRAGGLPDILLLLLSVADSLPNLDDVVAARGQSLGEKYAVVVIECLTSSKSETRSAALSLLDASVENGVVSLESINKATERLKPALQRSVGPLISKLAKSVPASSQPHKEYLSSRETVEEAQEHPVSSENGQKLRSKSHLPVDNGSTQRRRKEHTASAPSEQLTMPSTQAKHPLVPSSGKHVAGSTRSIIWPEYPEEPHGSVLENLKRFWAPFLPPATVSALFPSSGIKKQDDAKRGIELLTRSLLIDRTSGSTAVEEQLDLVLKWITFVLCSKESTTGLQDILSVLKDIFDFMLEINREFSDSEALETIPFLLDRVSSAKGRFRDAFLEINTLVESEALLPPKRLGMVCVVMIDSSPHAKARAQACHTCLACVEKTGLAGVGKKGVLSAAKLLSQETTKYRVAALDLMEEILSKMNGDVQRLVRICGPNLSDKARLLLEERWHKGQAKETASSAVSMGSPSRRSLGGSPQKTPLSGLRRDGKQPDIYDELPRLSLRAGGKEPVKPSPRMHNATQDTSDDAFAFTFSPRWLASPSNSESDRAFTSDPSTGNIFSFSTSSDIEPSGAAAALRARLLKIREKGKIPESGDMALDADQEKEESVLNGGDNFDTVINRPVDFNDQMDAIRSLLKKGSPIAENDPALETCVASLKIFHAALSRQQPSALGLTAAQLSELKTLLGNNMNATVDLLRRLIGFTINFGDERVNGGMLLPLLSLCLATLMALFRDAEFASKVSPEMLNLLIRESGTALLDARLSSSEELNEDTRTQMVRAINKLAVQAATGSARHTSFQALMALQQDLNSDNANSSTDDVFKSRLSRVVTKLFARVIKAEEATEAAYTQGRIDMEALICSMEDSLAACQSADEEGKSDAALVCSDMVKSLVFSILGTHGAADPLQRQMDELGIDLEASALGALVSACANEISLSEKSNVGSDAELKIDATALPSVDSFTRIQPKTPSKDVATLVSRLGRAPPGAERESALEAIRIYKSKYGGEELDAHLQQLSGAFRDFIEDQIKGYPTPQKQPPVEHAGASVSDRIRNLRSRLQATELAVQTVVDDIALEQAVSPPPQPMLPPPKPDPPSVPAATGSCIIAPSHSKLAKQSPSKLAAPGQSRLLTSSSSAQSLRERLAARHDSRHAEESSGAAESSATSTMGRAAALRARLEAVKNQQQQR